MDLAGSDPKTSYDDRQLFHNHSAWSFVPWHYLSGVRNKSIQKTARYQSEVQKRAAIGCTREQLEEGSRCLEVKYLLAVINSRYAGNWLAGRRRSKMHIYPDDWKPLPIFPASKDQQAAIVALVDEILALYGEYGHPLPSAAACRLAELEADIDRRVAELHE